jgi:hypothetical protein
MVKPRTPAPVRQVATEEEAEQLANELADKVYGQPKKTESMQTKKSEPLSPSIEKAKPIGISLPPTMIEKLQDTALKNKRSDAEHKTVSALILDALVRAGY